MKPVPYRRLRVGLVVDVNIQSFVCPFRSDQTKLRFTAAVHPLVYTPSHLPQPAHSPLVDVSPIFRSSSSALVSSQSQLLRSEATGERGPVYSSIVGFTLL